MKGVLLVDKPAGLTSHDVVDHVRAASGIRRIGHTGTLDPGATGLLVLCIGSATRLAQYVTDMDKTYEGTMRLGVITDSYDLDGKRLEERPVPDLQEDAIREAMARYVGDIEQLPPMVSAVKVGGQRLYKLARKGQEVERERRPVTVYEFSLLNFTPPDAQIRVRCSRGTYVRTLCHDVGQDLGCGAALASLRRTRVGKHAIENAARIDDLKTPDDVRKRLLDMDHVLDLPVACVAGQYRRLVETGGVLYPMHLTAPCPVSEGWVQIKSESGKLLALGEVQTGQDDITIQPKRVLTGSS